MQCRYKTGFQTLQLLREAEGLTLYVPWKCCMSSSFTYEGVMSVPPPNHHCPGMPFHSCTQAGHCLLIWCAVERSNLEALIWCCHERRHSKVRYTDRAHLSFKVSVVEVHGGSKRVVRVHD